MECKKMALIRIWQVLHEHSDYEHPLKQEQIVTLLQKDFGIDVERKTVGKNLALLKEMGCEIVSGRDGSYLDGRRFEDSELRMLIDCVLQSRHITSRHSDELIEKLCGLSNRYFKSHVAHRSSVKDWGKTENQALFYNIETVDHAIEEHRQVEFAYNKYGVDKKLHKTSVHRLHPYQLVLHNQRYYLMGYSDQFENMAFFRLDKITNIKVCEERARAVRTVPGYENGIDYKKLSTAMPYLFSDRIQRVDFIADEWLIDQVIDWFGKDIRVTKEPEEGKIRVSLMVSAKAMEYWALQYLNYVEIKSPASLRENVKAALLRGAEKYADE